MHKSWQEVKKHLKQLIEAEPISELAVIKSAGLSRNSYYKIFAPDRKNSPMRKATVHALAKVLRQQIKYVDGFPQFSPILALSPHAAARYVKDTIKHGTKLTGSLWQFSQKSGIDESHLLKIMDASPEVPIDILVLDALENAIAQIDLEGALKERDSSTIAIPELAKDGQTYHSETTLGEIFQNSDKLVTTSDKGLLQLTTEENLLKYNISDTERSELSMISQNRNSQTTIEHWVSILYALRALEQK